MEVNSDEEVMNSDEVMILMSMKLVSKSFRQSANFLLENPRNARRPRKDKVVTKVGEDVTHHYILELFDGAGFLSNRRELDSDFAQSSKSGKRDMATITKVDSSGVESAFDDCDLVLDQYPEDFKRFFKLWKDGILHFFPSRSPNYLVKDGLDPKLITAASEAKSAFHEDLKHYHGIKEVPKIVENQPVDVKALLSSHDETVNRDFLINRFGNKVPIDSLKGKHLLICCFFLPVFTKSREANLCRSIIAFNSEFPEKDRENFQIIIVPKLHRSLQNRVPFPAFIFKHFFSGFPENFLAIPSSDYQSCNHVYETIISSGTPHMGAVYINPEEMVLQTYGAIISIETIGAGAFPFTDSHLVDLSKQNKILKHTIDALSKERTSYGLGKELRSKPESLEELLECQSVYNMGNNEEQSVSYFGDKLVGLYIFRNGDFMLQLANIHEECIDKGKQFDIVLVCLDIVADSSWILEHVKHNLESEGFGLSYWWTLPYNSKVFRKLWRMCDTDFDDKLIILPLPPVIDDTKPSHKGQWSGDLQGKAVMCQFDGFNAYPFTRLNILEMMLLSLKDLTLQRLLKNINVLVWDEDDESLPKRTVPDLNGKQVLFCLDYYKFNYRDFLIFGVVRSWYPIIKAKHPDCEVVFVAQDKPPSNRKGDPIFEMPFLAMSPCSSLFEELGLDSACLTFGEDGQLLSRNANLYLNYSGIDRLFQNNLREEIVDELFNLEDDF